jgi:exosortase
VESEVFSPREASADDVQAVPLPHAERLLLAGVGVALVLVFAPTAAWLYGRWTLSVWQQAHGLLIPPIVAYFVWHDLRGTADLPRSSSGWGFVFLVPALLLHVVDTGLQTRLLSAVALLMALPGLALLFLGPARSRAIAFPLAFSVFMLPIPLAFTTPLHLVLRRIGAAATAQLAPWMGVPVYMDGSRLFLPNASIFISDACSGFSTLYAAVVVACLMAHTTHVWWRRVLVLGLAVPLAIASNIVRLVLLVLLVRWEGIGVLETMLHPLSGVLTFLLTLPVLVWLGGSRHKALA